MVLIKNAKVTQQQNSLLRKAGLLASQLLLSTVCWQLWQGPGVAQLVPLPGESTSDSEAIDESAEESSADTSGSTDEPLLEIAPVPVEPTVPTVEVLDLRPTLDDLDPRIRTGATPDVVEDAFEQYRLGPGDGIFVSVQRFPDLSFQANLFHN